MADVVTAAERSRMMAGIRSKDTKPELLLRRGLYARGFRFRLHDKRLAGKPDLVLPRYRAVIFAHGCFWHGHDCHLFKWPSTRPDFWRAKISRNQEIDHSAQDQLAAAGWRLAIVWECAVKGRTRLPIDRTLAELANWLSTDISRIEIRGT